ncbi:MAG: HPP family protein [Alphaproteobacteria bacterium]|nr:HPP family protein [Alphaproteobacteria bacterium]MBF0128450.1 HPP family protein [Alphaproteobacteria bacterium]
MLIAPFGASCVLLFGFPETPLSQPVNTIFGHMVATAIALGLRTVLPGEWWAIGIAVGLTILVMAALRISHPPAGADPVVVFLTDPGFGFLVTPVLVGAVTLATIAVLFHRLPPRAQYPLGD